MPLYVHESKPSWLDRLALCASIAVASGVGIAVSQLLTLHYYRKLYAHNDDKAGTLATVTGKKQERRAEEPAQTHITLHSNVAMSDQVALSPQHAASPTFSSRSFEASPLPRSRFHPLHVPGTEYNNVNSNSHVMPQGDTRVVMAPLQPHRTSTVTATAVLSDSTLANVHHHTRTGTNEMNTVSASSCVLPRPLVNTTLQAPQHTTTTKAITETHLPIYRIVITGGPCSGKTCGMAYLKKELEALGFAVYCVPEVATMLMTGGVQLWMTPEEQARERRKVLQTMRQQKAMAEYEKALQSVPELAALRDMKHSAHQEGRSRQKGEKAMYHGGRESVEEEEDVLSLMSPKSANGTLEHTLHSPRRDVQQTTHNTAPNAQCEEGEAEEDSNEESKASTLSAASLSAMKITIQRVVLQMMMMLEDCFYELAAMRAKPTVLLFDRGTMDGSAYCTEAEWQTILREASYTNEELRDGRYDAVVHFVTAALGAEEHYTLENNAVRHEAAEEAITVDAATRNAWRGHFLMAVIDNSTDFETKLARAAAFIRKVIGAAPRTTGPTRQAHVPSSVPAKPLPTTNTNSKERDNDNIEYEEDEEVCSPAMRELTFLMTGTRGHGCGVYASRATSRHPAHGEQQVEDNGVHEVYELDEYRARPYVFSPSRARDEDEEGEVQVRVNEGANEQTEKVNEPRLSAGSNGSYEPEPQQPSPPQASSSSSSQPTAHASPASPSPSHTVSKPSRPLVRSAMSVAVRARSWSSAAKDGLQRYFLVKQVDLSALPQDAICYHITVIHLRPSAQTIYAESIVRQVRCTSNAVNMSSEGHHVEYVEDGKPLYLHRVEYEPALDDADIGSAHTNRSINARPTRCTTTRAITKDRFVALATRCDPRQPLVSKITRRFLHCMRHLTLVTFEQPEALRGVSRLVGPADVSLEELPAWIEVDAELSMTGSELLM